MFFIFKQMLFYIFNFMIFLNGGHLIAPKIKYKRRRRKRQSLTAKREKSQTPTFV